MRVAHPAALTKIYHRCAGRPRNLHLGPGVGTKSTIRKRTAAADEGAQYNVEWLSRVLEGLDRNLVRGRGQTGYYVYVLNLCGRLKALVAGRRVHNHLVQLGVADRFHFAKYLVQMYLSCGSLGEASKLFNMLKQPNDIALWTAMIAAYAKNGRWQEALSLFEALETVFYRPIKVTYFAVMKAFSSPESLPGARMLHDRLVDIGGDREDVVKAAMIEMFGRCGSLEEARTIFKAVQRRSVVAWNALMVAHLHNGYAKDTLKIFWEMQRQGVRPDSVSLTTALNACTGSEGGESVREVAGEYGYEGDELVSGSLVHMFGRTGCLETARRIFDEMGHKSAGVWSKMIGAYSRHGKCKEGFVLLKEMHSKGLVRDAASCIAFLEACGSLLAVGAGRAAHAWVVKKGLEQDVFVSNAVVDMFGQCGCVGEARQVFDNMQERNWYSWNSMVAGYCYSGYSLEAIQLFLEMLQEGVRPNANTFTSVITACGHAGFLREGVLFMGYMETDYGVLPTADHHGCVVSLLGRSGWLLEADEYIEKRTDKVATVWEALLSACRIHGDVERGKTAAENSLKLSPRSSTSYVVLAGLYDSLGKTDDAAKIRESLATTKGLVEERVTSSILIGNAACHEFVTGDTSHPKTERIHAELEYLRQDMARAGFVADSSNLLMHEVAEEQQTISGHHSEMLAIGLGMLKTPAETPLRIIRNFRMCSECHTAAKFMSEALNRPIILRDGGSQLHCFSEGGCSCKDYW